MLSGQTPPLSANFTSSSPFVVEDDDNFPLELPYETEKPIGEQGKQETQTKSNNTSNIITTHKQTTTPVSRNILNTTSNHLTQSTTSATSGTIKTNTTTNVSLKINQNQQQSIACESTINSNIQVNVIPSTGATPKTITPVGNTKRPSNDTSGRSAALERAYVHDVYENCEEPTGAIRPRVAQFLAGLDPGSIVCDVGCGNGRYLTSYNPLICTIGADRCQRLTNVAKEKGGEVALCDNLELPFRDESFDAVLSLAVVHHFATTERRVGAIRELARILRIGGRVIITVWALEQRHRRFESQDVLIPWQPPKNRNTAYSDEDEDDDYLPPYHAYTGEDSTNSSRSAGDGDSSSLSSSSPGESCYSFVRRAIQKLASGRRQPWFLESWNSKDTKNDSSLDYEDAKDLPIELRRLEDFEDFPDPPLSAGLKSRSLGSILNPPPRQIVRSRSSVPSLGAQMSEPRQQPAFLNPQQSTSTFQHQQQSAIHSNHNQSLKVNDTNNSTCGNIISTPSASSTSMTTASAVSTASTITTTATGSSDRRPKLIKQKQSLCDDDYQLPDNSFNMISSNNYNSNYSLNNSYKKNCNYAINDNTSPSTGLTSNRLRKQSSLNEELMAANRLREKERVRKRIQKQMSLNEAFLCRSMFSKRLQIIREGFTSKLKTSTGSLERVTKNSIVKIMKNFKPNQFSTTAGETTTTTNATTYSSSMSRDHHVLSKQNSVSHKPSCPFYVCGTNNSSNCSTSNLTMSSPATTITNVPISGVNCNCNNFNNNLSNVNEDQQQEAKLRRHSRESGSDSSKDSSLQSDTSIESEDSFASVIFIPKPEQQQQQKIYQQHNNSNSSSSNSSSSNGTNSNYNNCISNHSKNRIPSVPTSPLIMPCPPTPAHSPAAANSTITSPPQAMAAVTAAMSIFSPQKILNNNKSNSNYVNNHYNSHAINSYNCNNSKNNATNGYMQEVISRNRFTFDEEHIIEQQKENVDDGVENVTVKEPIKPSSMGAIQKQPLFGVNSQLDPNLVPKKQIKITRQLIKDLPQIPKFRRPQSKNGYPIVRRATATQAIPKLMSLELFNPATDDLDSDSSDASSPDSVDSVINALIPCTASSDEDEKQKFIENKRSPKSLMDCYGKTIEIKDETDTDNTMTKVQQKAFFHSMDDQGKPQKPDSKMFVRQHSLDLKTNHNSTQQLEDTTDAKIGTNGNTIFINEVENDSNNLIYNKNADEQQFNPESNTAIMSKVSKNSHRDCADFAEQLSAQLLREIDDNVRMEKIDCRNLDGIGDIGEFIDDPFTKKRNNGEYRDLTALRDELRERRLMLANLSTQHSQQQSPTSSSTSSLSSQTRSFTIHEEDEEEEEGDADADANSSSSYSLNLFDNCKISKFKYKRNRHYNLNPETAYLLQDDYDSSVRDDDDDDIDHDVILEEDEDELETDDRTTAIGHFGEYCRKTSRNTIKCNEESIESSEKTTTTDNNNKNGENSSRSIENGQSTETWEHSNSSTSLDSPSQGGATTHHRYYHVFREGELDALINHHVTSLHIVSSYYERASWCVVAEKVQVWTI